MFTRFSILVAVVAFGTVFLTFFTGVATALTGPADYSVQSVSFCDQYTDRTNCDYDE